MGEDSPIEAAQDRKITWGLIVIVVVFVLLMSGIVLWITTSLIKNELGGGSNQPLPTEPLISETPIPPSPSPLPSPSPTELVEESQVPILVDATWTPVPGSKKYVRFLYWYVKPNKVTVGECVQVTWETENAVKLQLYRDGELILSNAPANGTLQDCPKVPGYAVYRLVGENKAGQSNWIQLQVKVLPAP